MQKKETKTYNKTFTFPQKSMFYCTHEYHILPIIYTTDICA